MRAIASVAVLGALVGSSFATMIYSTGFEEPIYTSSLPVVGTDGWFAYGGSPNDNGMVQTGIVHNGEQAAQFTRRTGFGTPAFGGFANGAVRSVGAGATLAEPIISVSWWMRLGQQGRYSQFWGMSNLMSPVGGIWSLGADDLGRVVYGNNPGALIVSSTTIARDTWHRYRVEVDANTNIAKMIVDTTQVGTFVVGTSALGFLAMEGWGIDQQPNDTTYFDDVSMERSAVPEPATLAILGLGAAALIKRRRR